MGPWASAIVGVASLAGIFFAIMGFRGLLQALDRSSGHCAHCGCTTLLPLPSRSHECRRCHFGELSLTQLLARRMQVRH
jgi:hypothetical protein